jgi:hypothetical protein
MKNSRLISILLCVLIIISGINLFVGVSNTIKIRQLENTPPVVIEKAESEASTTEKQTMTFRNDTTENTTEASPNTKEPTEKDTDSERPSEKVKNSSVCYVTSSGTKYHKDGCSYLKKTKTKMTVQEAKDCGYSPCSRCY